jgi:SAM-dependent methyltransferase
VPSQNLYAIDLEEGFFEVGYNLFRDKDRLNSYFFPADILSKDSELDQLKRKVDIIWIGAVLHLFSWENQVKAVKNMLRLLSPHPHSLIVGRVLGNTHTGEWAVGGVGTENRGSRVTYYGHNKDTFKKMFHEATDAMGEKWQIEVESIPLKIDDFVKVSGAEGSLPEGSIDLRFVATKLERLDSAVSSASQAVSLNMEQEF